MPLNERRIFRQPDLLLAFAFGFYVVCTQLSMAAMSVGAFLLFSAIVISARASGQALWTEFALALRSSRGRLYFRASVLLALALMVSLLAAMIFPTLYEGQALHIRFFKTFGKVWYLFWPLVLWIGLQRLTPERRRSVLRVWLLAFATLAVIGVFQHFTGWPRRQAIPLNERYFHVTLFLGHHLSVASVLIFPFFAALDQLRQRRPLLSRRLLGFAVVAGALALFGTYSRMLWVALPVGILLWAVLALPRKWGFAASIALILLAALALQHPKISERAHTSMGVGDRWALWQANLQFFKDRPLTGTGWRQNEEASGYYLGPRTRPGWEVFAGHAHNNFIDLLGGTGALGTLAWLFWWGVILVLLRRSFEASGSDRFPLAVLCALVVFHLNGLTQVNVWEAKVQHQLAWIIAWLLLWSSPNQAGDPAHKYVEAPEVKTG